MNPAYDYTRETTLTSEAAFFRRVYNWMVAGLALTGGVAYLTASSPTLLQTILQTPLFYVLIFGELGLVFYLSARIQRMSSGTASAMFIVYSVLNGLTLSFIFLAYTGANIASAFFVTAGTFAAMSVYGYTTKKSLASWGSFLIMGLIGIIIASVVNIFLKSETMYWVVTYAGVLIFTGLTAYDTQKIKMMAQEGFVGRETETKVAIMGALALYLDFINLFLFFLRIFGGSRD
jgi:hypothetical protein